MNYDMLAEPLSQTYTTSITYSTAVDLSGEELFRLLGTRRKVPAEGAREHVDRAATPTNYAFGEEEYVFVRNSEAVTAFAPGDCIKVNGTTAYGGYNCLLVTGIHQKQLVRGIVDDFGDSAYTIPAGSAGWIKCKGVAETLEDGTCVVGQVVTTTADPNEVADVGANVDCGIGLCVLLDGGADTDPVFVLLDL